MGSGRFRNERLRDLRKARDWSQSKVARKIGAHVTSVSDWERGANAPSGRHVASLAAVFEVPVREFYETEEEAEAASMAPLAGDSDAVARELADVVRRLVRDEVRNVA